jgi:hypothetical protein
MLHDKIPARPPTQQEQTVVLQFPARRRRKSPVRRNKKLAPVLVMRKGGLSPCQKNIV